MPRSHVRLALLSIAVLGLSLSAAAQDAIGQAPPAPTLGLDGTPQAPPPEPWVELGDVAPMALPTPMGEPELVTEIERARARLEAGHMDEAATMLRQLLDQHPRAEAMRSALLTLAIARHSAGDGAAAADAYGRFARLFPADRLAPRAARHAIALNLSLGRIRRATEGANRFARDYARRRRGEVAEVFSSIGAALEQGGQRRALVAHDRDWLRRWGEHAPIALRIHVMARLARALPASRARDALELRRRIVTLWDRQGARPLREDAEARARVAVDVARALLALADVERDLAEAETVPSLRRRRPSTAGLARWAREQLAPWFHRRMNGINRAERAYARVTELGPTEHQVAAAVDVGEMYLALVIVLDQAPVSAEIAHDPELLAVYRSAIESLAEPPRQRATQAFELALSLAARYHFPETVARRARARLRALDHSRVE